jgi:hypothetical protein
MTMRTYQTLKCDCGEIGKLKLSENDAPFSTEWHSYGSENLKLNGSFPKEITDWMEVMEKVKPTCPSCGNNLTHQHFV